MDLVERTKVFVKKQLLEAEAGHDFSHAERVHGISILLLRTEKADREICELAALLHDIADSKFHGGDEEKGPGIARMFLLENGLSSERTECVVEVIKGVSFKGGLKNQDVKSEELKIVQDADRLDALGAIGIARAFHYGGFRNRVMYDPMVKPVQYINTDEYRASKSPTVNHFYEKLLLLKDLMNTETGKKLAVKRHNFMLNFLDQFLTEWNLKDLE